MNGRYHNQSQLALETGPVVRPLQGAQSNKRGSSWKMNPGDTYKTLVDVRSETLDSEMLAVSVGAIRDGALDMSNTPDLVARIVWGVGGANFEAEMDINQGVTFGVPANFLRVDVAYNTDNGPGVGQVFQVSAGAGYGNISQVSSPVRRTVRVGALDPSGSGTSTADVAIPPWATSFTLSAMTIVVPPYPQPNLALFLLAGATFESFFRYTDASNNGNQAENTFPLPNGTDVLRITNLDATYGVDQVTVVFNLSF